MQTLETDKKPAPAGTTPPHPVRDFLLGMYCWFLVLLVPYILAAGPLYWSIYEQFQRQSGFLYALYYPLALLCYWSDAVSHWFNWYIGLWLGLA